MPTAEFANACQSLWCRLMFSIFSCFTFCVLFSTFSKFCFLLCHCLDFELTENYTKKIQQAVYCWINENWCFSAKAKISFNKHTARCRNKIRVYWLRMETKMNSIGVPHHARWTSSSHWVPKKLPKIVSPQLFFSSGLWEREIEKARETECVYVCCITSCIMNSHNTTIISFILKKHMSTLPSLLPLLFAWRMGHTCVHNIHNDLHK